MLTCLLAAGCAAPLAEPCPTLGAGNSAFVVRIPTTEVLSDDEQPTLEQLAGVQSFFTSWPSPERLGTAEHLTEMAPGVVDVWMGFAPDTHDVIGLAWAWHDLADFLTFS